MNSISEGFLFIGLILFCVTTGATWLIFLRMWYLNSTPPYEEEKKIFMMPSCVVPLLITFASMKSCWVADDQTSQSFEDGLIWALSFCLVVVGIGYMIWKYGEITRLRRRMI